jgi:hypothetical protein
MDNGIGRIFRLKRLSSFTPIQIKKAFLLITEGREGRKGRFDVA